MDVEPRFIDNLKGKGLFAKRNFKTGSVIFEEEPLVCCQFSWNAAYKYRACDHCLKPLETAEENARRLTGKPYLSLPFSDCCATNKAIIAQCDACGTEYCSLNCQILAYNQYHKTLCLQTKERNTGHPLEILNETWKQMHYPPETNSIMLIVRLLALIHQSGDREAMQARILQFCHRTVNEDTELAHKLLGEKFADQLTVLHDLVSRSVPHSGIEQFLSPEGFRSLLALIGTNGQGVGTSAVSQWVTRASDLSIPSDAKQELDDFIDKLYEDMDQHSGNFLNNEGVALFQLQSVCNHSCVPNAEVAFLHNSSRLSLVALRDIPMGEEISISYLDPCSLERSRHSRQKFLKENYLFECGCEKCVQQVGDPDVTSEEEEMSE